jgi:hypothetical protein
MRLLFGMVLGAVLTVGGAYYRDSTYASPTATPPVQPIVNWEVAREVADNVTRGVRQEIGHLLGR